MKSAERTKVLLKTILSKPRLVNEVADALQVRPKPVPLVWMRITKTKRAERIASTIKKKAFIIKSIILEKVMFEK